MLIIPQTNGSEYQALRQRLREDNKADLYPLPVKQPVQDSKNEIQPQPVPDVRPTPIPEPDRVTLGQAAPGSEGFSLTYRPDGRVPEQVTERVDYLSQMMQAMTDAKVGFDREKYEELQEKIDEILAKEELTDADRSKLEALEQEQRRLFEVAAKRLAEKAVNEEKV